MKKLLLVFLSLIWLTGCGGSKGEETVVCTYDKDSIKIDIEMTAKDNELQTLKQERTIAFDEADKETNEKSLKDTKELFDKNGVIYSYELNDTSYTDKLEIDLTTMSAESLVASGIQKEGTEVVFLDAMRDEYKKNGYTCK